MDLSKKEPFPFTENELLSLPDPDCVEIVPGMQFPLKRLATEEGWKEAIRLRGEWIRKNHNPLRYIKPETLKIHLPISYFALDAQKFICLVAKLITQRTTYPLRYGEHPEAPPIIAKRIREILHRDVESRLREFVNVLIEDIYFEAFLSLEGELRALNNRAEIRKTWGRKIAGRAIEQRRRILAREGLFPTAYLLLAALQEAVEAILNGDPHKKITQSEVVKYFSESATYSKCGDESTLRRCLRSHNLNWKDVVKDLYRQQRFKLIRRCQKNDTSEGNR